MSVDASKTEMGILRNPRVTGKSGVLRSKRDGYVRWSLGRLQEGGLADVALNVLGSGILCIQNEFISQSTLPPRDRGNRRVRLRTTLSWDLGPALSFWLRSRFCCAFAPWDPKSGQKIAPHPRVSGRGELTLPIVMAWVL
jgi:hypothetical protein